ncbi:primosomal replication protein N [Crenobacter intestini]|uniref:Replication restart protein PriB n=1 Tax=Crenobacter intestini TaxID=2563443 RepID=A0A4V4N7Z1_9NEIS|nr:primosomal replication protein N [Crenobacter intestini]TIC82373.1 primosomal replication protein N [Crenobacter intestini]
MQNRLVLTASVTREEALRYTPAGIPVLEMWLAHGSRQREAGLDRDVRCEIQAVMVGEAGRKFAGRVAGQVLTFEGFLSQRSLRNPRLVLHIESAEFVKG